jgi:hypothetical protein
VGRLRPLELTEEEPEELLDRVIAPATLGRADPALDLDLEHVRVAAELLLEVRGVGDPPSPVVERVVDLLAEQPRPIRLDVDG